MEFIDEEEEMALLKKQLLMSRSNGVMDSFNKGLGEVRKVNIVYYLCLNGKVDQPHLIRIHVYNNGVRLRDVKRWLSELRGKDMPDSFAWSYKRKYKSGYVWQDLMDRDLITPICDNEYILMGSKVPSSFHFSPIDTFSCGLMSPLGEIDLGMVVEEEKQMAPPKSKPGTRQISFELEEDVPPKSPPIVEKSSPESQHDQQNKHDVNFKIEIRSDQEEEEHEEKQEPYWPEESPQEGKRKKGKQKRRALRDIIDGPTDDMNTSPLLLLPDQPQRERRKAFNWSLCIRTSSVKYP